MRHSKRLTVLAAAGIVAAGMAAAGCATPWFDQPKADPEAHPRASTDPKSVAAAYINSLCTLPRDQRDLQVRELNEAVLPNHATISCGPGGPDGPP